MGGEPKGACGPRGAARHLAADYLSAGNSRVRSDAQPGAKTLARLKAGELGANFGEDGRGDTEVDARYGRQVDATDPVQLRAEVKLGLVGILARGLVLLAARDARRSGRGRIGDGVKLPKRGFELAVARG